MKKMMMIAAAVAMMAAAPARAECVWSWWTSSPAENATKDVSGCALGFASQVASVSGAQVSICMNLCEKVNGAQVTFGYNRAGTVWNGPQVGFWNAADGAALQFGLLNFNKEGFLPFFPFFNMSKKYFGSPK